MIASRYSVVQSASVAGRRGRAGGHHLGAAADFAARRVERVEDRHEMRRRGGAVDQQRLGRAADAGAPHLGVDGEPHRHVEVGRAVDVEMADAFEMREHRHARLLLHPRDQALAAARHDHVEIAGKALQHLADGGAVGGRHQLDRIFRQSRFDEPFDEAGMDGRRGIERIRAAAQDHRIAGLEAERAGVGRHVRPALVDDADDAERRAHALDLQPVRPVPFGDHLADRIGSPAIARMPSAMSRMRAWSASAGP